MNFSIYHVLGVCAPVAVLDLLFVLAAFDFLKEHREKARGLIVCLILNIPLAGTIDVCLGHLLESMVGGNIKEIIFASMLLILVFLLLLFVVIESLKLFDEMQYFCKAACPDTASISGQSALSPQAALRDYLEEPINDFPWLRVYTEDENRRGLLALRELAQRIRTRRGQLLHCGYLFHIFTAQKALGMGQYSLACHELQDVVHFYQAPEVMALIYKMLTPYFDEVTPMEQAAKRMCCPHCGNPCHAEDRYCRFCGERLFKRFSELPEDLQKVVIEQTERSIDLYLQN
ncbi:hypothetical protein DSECCO2_235430 [anaerobic digester metagenome]